MNWLILGGVIVVAEVVADRIITNLDKRKEGKTENRTWAVPAARQAGKVAGTTTAWLEQIVGNLTPEQKRYYELIREKLLKSQTSDGPTEGAEVNLGWLPKGNPINQPFSKPPAGWSPPYGHSPYGPPYREQGIAPDYKTYPERDA